MSRISLIDSMLSAQGAAVSNSASAGSANLFAQTLQQSIAAQTNAASLNAPAQPASGAQQPSSASSASNASSSQPQQNNGADNANASNGTGTVHPGDSAQSSQPAQPGSSQDASSTKSSSSTDSSAQQTGNAGNDKAGDANSKSQDTQASNAADASATAAAAAAAAAAAQARANAAADANKDASAAADAASADATAAALAGDAKADGTGDHKGTGGVSTGGKSVHQKVDSALAALNSGRTDLVAALPVQNFAAGAANGASDKAGADLSAGGPGNSNGKGFGIGPMLGDARTGANGAMNNGMQTDNASVAATAAEAQQTTQASASAAAAASAAANAANADAAAAASLPAATDGIDALNAALAASQAGGAGAAASGGTGASQAAKSGTAAYTENALAPEVGSTDWDEALSQKVVFMSNLHQQSAELTLNPANLGPLQVVLQVADNHAHALFVSQHQEVRAAIEAALPKLREAMEQNGIGLGSTSVSDGFARQSGQQAQDGGRSSGSRGGYDSGNANDVAATTTTTAGPTRRTVGLVDTFA
jgi:flagellar hook-length control protein FliK